MHQRRIAIVAGTRPEVIKLAPLYRALQADPRLDVRWIHTGQHDEMARDMLRCFQIVPHHQFAREGASLEAFGGACRAWLDLLREQQRWDACIVQGDTESAFQGALCAFYGRIPVIHVEAGLRTMDLGRPFPEEGIRQMISRVATLHCAPTERAAAALRGEGVPAAQVVVTGNTVVDAQQWVCRHHGIPLRGASPAGHLLVTAHRREHWGRELEDMFLALADVSRLYPNERVVFPVHLNPVVQRPAREILGRLPNVFLLPPLDYVGMQRALSEAALLLTDSGGLQEEAPTFGVPTLVLRSETERPEAVQAGCAMLVGPGRSDIVSAVRRVMDNAATARAMRAVRNPFGDGHASRRIAAAVAGLLGLEERSPLAIALRMARPAVARKGPHVAGRSPGERETAAVPLP